MLVSGLELWQWRHEAKAGAAAAGVPIAEVDWLLQEVTGLDRLALRLESFKERSHIEIQQPLAALTQLWQRRLHDRLPVQYLAGVAPWRNFSLTVSPAVLIPRPETECLIDLAVESCREARSRFSTTLEQGQWADLGTGSGAIAIGLAGSLTKAIIHAVDRSPAALAIAQQNAYRLGFANRIHFYQGSWFEPLGEFKGQLSGVVANPPYIPSDMVPQLQPEVARHEPLMALDGGPDGLDCIRQLVSGAPTYLHPGGVLLLEMMAGQADAVAELLRDRGSYCQIQIFSDLEGINRFALAYTC